MKKLLLKLFGSLLVVVTFLVLLLYPPQIGYSADLGKPGCKECKESLNSPGKKSCQTPVEKKAKCGSCNLVCKSDNVE